MVFGYSLPGIDLIANVEYINLPANDIAGKFIILISTDVCGNASSSSENMIRLGGRPKPSVSVPGWDGT